MTRRTAFDGIKDEVLRALLDDTKPDVLTADMIRSRRAREVRAKSQLPYRYSKFELEAGREKYPEDVSAIRPRTRADCIDAPRPCPFVGCRHHLYLDVNERNGSIKFNFPDLEPEQMLNSCSLDIADEEIGTGLALEDVGALMNVTRERIRQLEAIAFTEIERQTRGSDLTEGRKEFSLSKTRKEHVEKSSLEKKRKRIYKKKAEK